MKLLSWRNGAVLAASLTTVLLGHAAPARANLVIIPTYASSITNDPQAATIESTIQSAINVYQSTFTNPITVNITFQEGGGLGGSSTYLALTPYANYLAALAAHNTSADQMTAHATLPAGTTNPVNGAPNIMLTTANARALGLAGSGPGGLDSTITLNTSIMNLSRTGPQDPSKYDLMAVASHEIDEALGKGSTLDNLSFYGRYSSLRAEDLYRYAAPGTRSFTTSSSAVSYLSFDSGTTNLVGYNQSGGGSDYGDWYSVGPHTPRVQDAYGTPGAQPNLGGELRILNVLGYDNSAISPVPEPTTLAGAAMAVVVGLGYGWRRRRHAA